MRILFITGYFDKYLEKRIIKNNKIAVENAANDFQYKLIDGFISDSKIKNYTLDIISAPFMGAYPNGNEELFFKYTNINNKIKYASFINIWGYRNYSRYINLKKMSKDFLNDSDNEKYVIVYSVHTPFIKVANYLKKKNPNIKVLLIVLDLPEYMNLSKKKSVFYKIGKKIDNSIFYKENKNVDAYMILTDYMKTPLKIKNKPYFVKEGIVSENEIMECKKHKEKDKDLFNVVYTGKLNEDFGIRKLIEAFQLVDNPQWRLIICGNGELREFVELSSNIDKRIIYLGQVPMEEANKVIFNADILVNPRENINEYTKYSFPSKIIKYMMSCNKIVAYKLDGMPDYYDDFLYFVDGDSVLDLKNKMVEISKIRDNLKEKKGLSYIKSNCLNSLIVDKMVEILKNAKK